MTFQKLFVIAKDVPFPIGMAATNRIVSYLKFLSSYGFNTNVFPTKPTEKEEQVINKNISGKFQGIYFEYLSATTIWPKKSPKHVKAFLMIKTHLKLIEKIIIQRPHIVLTYSDSLSLKIILYCLHKVFQFKYIIEETEYPKIFKRTSNSILIKLYLFFYRQADGMLLITNKLKEYYSNVGVKNSFVLPMSVDISRFSKRNDDLKESNYFAYVGGSGGFQRDGVIHMIKSFLIFSESHIGFKFKIVGDLDLDSFIVQEIIEYVDKFRLSDKVIFTGFMSTEQIPDLLENARGILLTPEYDFASGGFPTKLGEFLASGTPVILTSIDDFSDIFSNDNVFMVKPGDHDEIATAMSTIIDDPILAKKIGEGGRLLANTIFNPGAYINDLRLFLKK